MEETKETISCMAVGDMLDSKLEDYKDALAGGADDDVIEKMGKEIDAIEAVYDKCKTRDDDSSIGDGDTTMDEADEN